MALRRRQVSRLWGRGPSPRPTDGPGPATATRPVHASGGAVRPSTFSGPVDAVMARRPLTAAGRTGSPSSPNKSLVVPDLLPARVTLTSARVLSAGLKSALGLVGRKANVNPSAARPS